MRTLLAIAAAVLLVVWIMVDRQRAEVSFLVGSVTLPLWVALSVAGALGALIGYLLVRRRSTGAPAARRP
ncbi:LapA family protein [Modestobacter sp. VKM Ac-2978]|uniref:LapA family protein n=1 Tax=Modestobacter sp. VKM Ac-2978 TaxID=3004132 RepID=UPI0022AAE2FC|nr:LapA family protein [Modestobacter sp. VKM Ac-2978]MCZ2849783.1 LapA family protein [Modestobacter sp. VKM Ac-2978]